MIRKTLAEIDLTQEKSAVEVGGSFLTVNYGEKRKRELSPLAILMIEELKEIGRARGEIK
jgi:hypothetical protein